MHKRNLISLNWSLKVVKGIKGSQIMRIIQILVLYFYNISVIYCKKDKIKCECGIPLPASKKTKNNARIFNGQDAAPMQFPWQVFLEIKAEINGSTLFGGAVLVSKKHILATAHAFHDHVFPFAR